MLLYQGVDMLHGFDLSILYFFNHQLANPVLDGFFLFIAESKIFLTFLILFALMLFYRGSLRLKTVIILMIICIAIVDPVCHYILKPLVGRIRPCYTLHDIRLLVGCGGKFSFPSNHAANSFAIAGLISFFYRKYTAPLFTIALLIGLSRIYLGRHYPSDVLGGAIFGLLVAALVIYLAKQLLNFLASRGYMKNAVGKIQGALAWKK